MTKAGSPSNRLHPRRTAEDRLPGDPDKQELLARMIRVDHAGEYGAKRIYAGQLAILGRRPEGETIRKMAAQEEAHLAAFEKLMVERRVRPTVLHPLWHVAGFALGAATALLGERAAMACTVAVEDVIDDHYKRQAEALGDDEKELRETIEDFRAHEIDHKEIGLAHGAEAAPAYPLLLGTIKAASRLAIWLSTRV
ncbi:MAG TPA: demethoxyubiquinone hydroxylase family protein [Alphaproteobacteria bacterium]|nr:demethoxyubiquinone hydroxylase family protein [Alphaproteobacteria bacterium]